MKDEMISTAQITFEGIRSVVRKILDYAGEKPIAFLLEGGYNIDSLVRSVDVTLEELER
jgi:acetoin utilization deacetylase AcuC-like enzyme